MRVTGGSARLAAAGLFACFVMPARACAEEAAPAPKELRDWYGAPLLVLDGAAWITALVAENSDAHRVTSVAVTVGIADGFVVHSMHQNHGRAIGSLLLRGTLTALVFAVNSKNHWFCFEGCARPPSKPVDYLPSAAVLVFVQLADDLRWARGTSPRRVDPPRRFGFLAGPAAGGIGLRVGARF